VEVWWWLYLDDLDLYYRVLGAGIRALLGLISRKGAKEEAKALRKTQSLERSILLSSFAALRLPLRLCVFLCAFA
jgi:hypothetical protein